MRAATDRPESPVDDLALTGDPAAVLADPAAVDRLAAAVAGLGVVDAGRAIAVDGVCASVGGDVWHPDTSASATAIRICRTCPALVPCRLLALRNREPNGIWGGLRAAERRRLLRVIARSRRSGGTTRKDTA